MASISKLGKTYVSAAEVTEFVTTKAISLTDVQCVHIAKKLCEKLQIKSNDAKIMETVLKALAGV